VGDDGKPKGASQYIETLVALSRQAVKPDKVSVVADGSDGKAAIVRVSGVLADIPFLDTFKALSQAEYGFPAAIDYVLDHQAPGGEIAWNHHADGTIDRRALLTASSSIYMSVRCAVAIAEEVGEERPDWELSIGLLAHAIAHRQDVFWPKPRWSMDWYYPVLTGVIRGDDATRRIDERWEQFIVDGLGCRCVADQPWVTTAETCELVLALDAAGDDARARKLFAEVQFMRTGDGAYQEGWVFPKDVFWPGRTPPWTSGAVLLAADALDRRSQAWNLFRGDDLPSGLAADEVTEHLLGAGVDLKSVSSERTA
jgi:hypothetical protein